jgi:hypothetical protein
VVTILLDRSADTNAENRDGETPIGLAEKYPVILSMLAKVHEDGPLEGDARYPEIDREFTATVVEFFSESGIEKPSSKDVTVYELLKHNEPPKNDGPLRDNESPRGNESLKDNESLKANQQPKDNEAAKGIDIEERTPSFRWLHLPANNVSTSDLIARFKLNLVR